MSAMANPTHIVTTVTKPATNPRDADTTPRVNIQDFCEKYYEDILPIIMDKVLRDKRKEVHARLNFEEGSRERRTREDSHHSSARALTTRPERLKIRDRLRYGRTNSRGHPRGRSRPHRLDASNEGCLEDKECFRGIKESYDDSYSHSYRDRDRSHHMKRRRDNESPLSSVSKSDSSDGRYWKSKSKRHKPTDEDDLTRPWMYKEEDLFIPRIRGARVWFDELSKSVDSYKDLKAAFLAYFMQQKKHVKDPLEIHNIKQKDEETIEDFMERFKVEIGRIKGAPECMRISGFMHGVNDPELTKRLNEHVPKTMEEMMITTTAFIRGEAAAAIKKKGHTSWRAHDQSKRQTSEKGSDFQGHPREGSGSSRFTPLTRTPMEILAAEVRKFQPPPPIVTPVEKRSSNKLVRAGKLSHLIKQSEYPSRLLSRCSATDRDTPVMSDGCHVNISKFSFKSEHSSVRPFVDNVPLSATS
nr:reverse transcriptase domain-containing protein [Tanacetum cinerariifolium]